MVNTRLIRTVPGSMRLALASVVLQWVSLVANVLMIAAICWML